MNWELFNTSALFCSVETFHEEVQPAQQPRFYYKIFNKNFTTKLGMK